MPHGETSVRRLSASRYGLSETPHPSIRTVYDLMMFNSKNWGDSPGLGTRRVIKIHTEKQIVTTDVHGIRKQVEKDWLYWELGPFEFKSYNDVAEEALRIGAGLRELGLDEGDRIVVYADTS